MKKRKRSSRHRSRSPKKKSRASSRKRSRGASQEQRAGELKAPAGSKKEKKGARQRPDGDDACPEATQSLGQGILDKEAAKAPEKGKVRPSAAAVKPQVQAAPEGKAKAAPLSKGAKKAAAKPVKEVPAKADARPPGDAPAAAPVPPEPKAGNAAHATATFTEAAPQPLPVPGDVSQAPMSKDTQESAAGLQSPRAVLCGAEARPDETLGLSEEPAPVLPTTTEAPGMERPMVEAGDDRPMGCAGAVADLSPHPDSAISAETVAEGESCSAGGAAFPTSDGGDRREEVEVPRCPSTPDPQQRGDAAGLSDASEDGQLHTTTIGAGTCGADNPIAPTDGPSHADAGLLGRGGGAVDAEAIVPVPSAAEDMEQHPPEEGDP
eukprot:GGOE01014456.1.p1 GENE.GGOE01014456.1~~GGOE01014456.1.p1  ORF type:complete len:413 (+),score=53.78 GGOE01014456.1:105-1241(+)